MTSRELQSLCLHDLSSTTVVHVVDAKRQHQCCSVPTPKSRYICSLRLSKVSPWTRSEAYLAVEMIRLELRLEVRRRDYDSGLRPASQL